MSSLYECERLYVQKCIESHINFLIRQRHLVNLARRKDNAILTVLTDEEICSLYGTLWWDINSQRPTKIAEVLSNMDSATIAKAARAALGKHVASAMKASQHLGIALRLTGKNTGMMIKLSFCTIHYDDMNFSMTSTALSSLPKNYIKELCEEPLLEWNDHLYAYDPSGDFRMNINPTSLFDWLDGVMRKIVEGKGDPCSDSDSRLERLLQDNFGPTDFLKIYQTVSSAMAETKETPVNDFLEIPLIMPKIIRTIHGFVQILNFLSKGKQLCLKDLCAESGVEEYYEGFLTCRCKGRNHLVHSSMGEGILCTLPNLPIVVETMQEIEAEEYSGSLSEDWSD